MNAFDSLVGTLVTEGDYPSNGNDEADDKQLLFDAINQGPENFGLMNCQ